MKGLGVKSGTEVGWQQDGKTRTFSQDEAINDRCNTCDGLSNIYHKSRAFACSETCWG